MTSDAFDYVAELARIRRAQGLAEHVPQHVRDAVAALLASADTIVDSQEPPKS